MCFQTGEFSARFLLKLPVDFSNIPVYLLKVVTTPTWKPHQPWASVETHTSCMLCRRGCRRQDQSLHELFLVITSMLLFTYVSVFWMFVSITEGFIQMNCSAAVYACVEASVLRGCKLTNQQLSLWICSEPRGVCRQPSLNTVRTHTHTHTGYIYKYFHVCLCSLFLFPRWWSLEAGGFHSPASSSLACARDGKHTGNSNHHQLYLVRPEAPRLVSLCKQAVNGLIKSVTFHSHISPHSGNLILFIFVPVRF